MNQNAFTPEKARGWAVWTRRQRTDRWQVAYHTGDRALGERFAPLVFDRYRDELERGEVLLTNDGKQMARYEAVWRK